MIDNSVIQTIVDVALLAMIMLLPLAFWRVYSRGSMEDENIAADRLVGVDIITTLLVGIIILLALTENNSSTVDLGIALAALSFAGTLSIARYISEGRVF
ncbi:MAG: monovalent cation/H+ antiporter complex subunit F [Aggregatilineales bacterium]